MQQKKQPFVNEFAEQKKRQSRVIYLFVAIAIVLTSIPILILLLKGWLDPKTDNTTAVIQGTDSSYTTEETPPILEPALTETIAPEVVETVAPPTITPPAGVETVAPAGGETVTPPTVVENVAPPVVTETVTPPVVVENVAPPAVAETIAPSVAPTVVEPPVVAETVAPPAVTPPVVTSTVVAPPATILPPPQPEVVVVTVPETPAVAPAVAPTVAPAVAPAVKPKADTTPAKRTFRALTPAELAKLKKTSTAKPTTQQLGSYNERLYSFVRGQWVVPSPVQLQHKKYKATISLEVLSNGTIRNAKLITPSFNRVMDSSVNALIQKLKQSKAPVPGFNTGTIRIELQN